MKKLVVGLFLGLVALFVMVWNIAAHQLVADTKVLLSQVEKNKNVVLSYDEISATGFPLRVGASVKGLKVKTATGQLINSFPMLKVVFKDLSEGDINTLSTLENTVEFTSDVKVTSNLLVNNLKIKFGDGRFISKDKSGESVFYSKGETLYAIQFKHSHIADLFSLKNRLASGDADNVQSIDRKPNLAFVADKVSQNFYGINLLASIVNEVQSISLESAQSELTDKDNNLAYSVKDVQYKIDHFTLANNEEKYHLIIQAKDARATDKLNTIYNGIDSGKIMLKMLGKDSAELFPSYKNLQLDFEGAFPWGAKSAQDSANNAWLHINKFDYLADNVNMSVNGRVNATVGGKMPSLDQVSLHGFIEFPAAAYQYNVDRMSASILKEIKAKHPNEKAITLESIKSIIPRLHEFGKITFDLKSSRDVQGVMEKTLLKIASVPYSGSLKISRLDSGVSQNKYNVNLSLENYKALLHDGVGYAKKLTTFIGALDAAPYSKVEFNDDLEAKTLSFIYDIIGTPMGTTDSISIPMQFDANGLASLGKLSREQAQAQLQGLIGGIKVTPISNEEANAKILEQLKAKAKSGDADAQFKLGKIYYDGKIVSGDYLGALVWYTEAAKQGHADASNNLGVMIAQGKGMKKNNDMAKQLFAIAKTKGNPYAAINLDNLNSQKGYPALITVGPYGGMSVTCEKYDHQAIDNLIDTNRRLGWKEPTLIKVGQPGAIPENLRPYAQQRAKAAGININ